MSQRDSMRVLLLHEDHSFAKDLMKRLQSQGIELHWRRSLVELGSIGRLGSYDLLLVEALTGPVNGFEVAEYVDSFFPGLPVVLVGVGALPLGPRHRPRSVIGAVGAGQDIDAVVNEVRKCRALHGDVDRRSASTPPVRYASA